MPKLEQTPLAINDIRAIGELITAEYYGEVIRSLKTITRTDLTNELENDFLLLKEVYTTFSRESSNGNKLVRRFRNEGYNKDHRFQRLRKLCSKNERNFILGILGTHTWKQFRDEYQSEIIKYVSKRENGVKGEIVYLGRGWVKAGFDLTKIDFNHGFSVSNDTLFIRNLDPLLLDADINPWLVPGKIAGFEIIKMQDKISIDEIQSVKRACKLGLKQEAIASGIYEFALSAGTQSFEGLFGLMDLPGNSKISTVIIEPTKYFEYKIDILNDAAIDSLEFGRLQTLISNDTSSLDSVWFTSMDIQTYYLRSFLEEIDAETRGSYNYLHWSGYYDSIKVKR
jgi:hypothetical protein